MRRAVAVSLLVSVILGLTAIAAASSGHDSAARATGARPLYCPRHDPDGYDARRLIGRRVPVARDVARAHDCTLRIVKRDGEALPVTEDFSWTRINVAIYNRHVTGIDGVY